MSFTVVVLDSQHLLIQSSGWVYFAFFFFFATRRFVLESMMFCEIFLMVERLGTSTSSSPLSSSSENIATTVVCQVRQQLSFCYGVSKIDCFRTRFAFCYHYLHHLRSAMPFVFAKCSVELQNLFSTTESEVERCVSSVCPDWLIASAIITQA